MGRPGLSVPHGRIVGDSGNDVPAEDERGQQQDVEERPVAYSPLQRFAQGFLLFEPFLLAPESLLFEPE